MYQLDQTDIRILNILQADARITERALATRVFKAAPTVHERLARLEANGFIRGYVALLDRALVGRPVLVVLMVRLRVQSTELLLEFEDLVRGMPEVQSNFLLREAKNFGAFAL